MAASTSLQGSRVLLCVCGGIAAYKAAELVRRLRSDERLADSKTGTLIGEARDIDYILVDNEKEALALENNLIKQSKPRFNILLRDDKTYPYIKLSSEKYPRVYVTRRLRKDGSTYFGPYFPANLAHRLVHFIRARQLTRQVTRLLITAGEFATEDRELSPGKQRKASQVLAQVEQALQRAVEKRAFRPADQKELAERIRRRRKELEKLLEPAGE